MTHEETTMDIVAFYDRIGDLVDDIPTSSQASLEATAQAFVNAAEKGRDVFAGFIGSRMSGMFDSACLVAKQVKERYPDWHACMLDTGSNSLDEGYGVLAAARAALRGAPLAECHDIAVRTCLSSRWLFTPRSLAFLKAGGRIGRAASLVGNLLRICPILTVFDGEVEVAGKYPTFNKSVSKIAKMFERALHRTAGTCRGMGAGCHRAHRPGPCRRAARLTGHRCACGSRARYRVSLRFHPSREVHEPSRGGFLLVRV